MLLLSYHRRLRMISEALEFCVEGGRVSHSWCMCVVSHGYCRAGMEVVDGMHAGQSQGDWSHVGRCWIASRMRGDALTTPDQIAALGRVDPELVDLPKRTLTRDATRRLRFAVHAVS